MSDKRSEPPSAEQPVVALVVAGAAARGAYEAGAIAELLPALEAQGLRPSILLGTSSGAINAALTAMYADRPAVEAGLAVAQVWAGLDESKVFAPMPRTTVTMGVRYLWGWLTDDGRIIRLLDTRPLWRTAAETLDAGAIRDHVAAGLVDTVGVVATTSPRRGSSGRSRLFVTTGRPDPLPADLERAQDIVRVDLDREHVLASAAIPAVFAPVRVSTPAAAADWYVDGGVRLNVPLRPALALGATHVVVVSSNALEYPVVAEAPEPPLPQAPDVEVGAAQLLHVVLADRITEDLIALRHHNRLVEQAARAPHPFELVHEDGTAQRIVRYLAVCPQDGDLGDLADNTYRTRPRPPQAFDYAWLRRGLAAAGQGSGYRELLSYLYFHPAYLQAQIDMGRQHALAALSTGWRS